MTLQAKAGSTASHIMKKRKRQADTKIGVTQVLI